MNHKSKILEMFNEKIELEIADFMGISSNDNDYAVKEEIHNVKICLLNEIVEDVREIYNPYVDVEKELCEILSEDSKFFRLKNRNSILEHYLLDLRYEDRLIKLRKLKIFCINRLNKEMLHIIDKLIHNTYYKWNKCKQIIKNNCQKGVANNESKS